MSKRIEALIKEIKTLKENLKNGNINLYGTFAVITSIEFVIPLKDNIHIIYDYETKYNEEYNDFIFVRNDSPSGVPQTLSTDKMINMIKEFDISDGNYIAVYREYREVYMEEGSVI